jgi:hypothetical protein
LDDKEGSVKEIACDDVEWNYLAQEGSFFGFRGMTWGNSLPGGGLPAF